MSRFSKIFDTKVKDLAKKCILDPEAVNLLYKRDMYNLFHEEIYVLTNGEKEYLKEASSKYHDIYGMYNISEMIWRVEHALADGRDDIARLIIIEVRNVLSKETYFTNVFNSDETSEEWKNILALRDGLDELINA